MNGQQPMGLLSPGQLNSLFLASIESLETREQAAISQSEAVADELIHATWRRLIGPAWRLIRALLVLRLKYSILGHESGEHLHATNADLAVLVGVGLRTVERWLSPQYAGKRWLDIWISRRVHYTTRSDGLPCCDGQVFRLTLEPRSPAEELPARRPTLAALRTNWRYPEEFEQGKTLVVENDRHKKADLISFRLKRKGNPLQIKADGFHVSLLKLSSDSLVFNDRHSGKPPTLGTLRSSDAWSKAGVVAERLGDRGSEAFWCKQFRRTQREESFTEGMIWRAVGLALEARSSGSLRGSPARYAVGVLKRAVAMG